MTARVVALLAPVVDESFESCRRRLEQEIFGPPCEVVRLPAPRRAGERRIRDAVYADLRRGWTDQGVTRDEGG